jgi:hypothetical protein
MIRCITVILIAVLTGLGLWVVVNPLMHSKEGKMKVIMFGRSTMSLWFKHWNWPYPLRIKTTYKPWPIPYKAYSQGNLYLKYFPVNGPERKKTGAEFGEKMLQSVRAGLDSGKYDASFFKFCFVDFPVEGNEEKKTRLNDLKDVVIKVHTMTSQRNIKLIVGNALPLSKPNDVTLSLQKEYNSWLQEYAARNRDVLVFDLFGQLTEKDGRLIMDYIQAKGDDHPGDKAYTLLDKTFFPQVEEWLLQKR